MSGRRASLAIAALIGAAISFVSSCRQSPAPGAGAGGQGSGAGSNVAAVDPNAPGGDPNAPLFTGGANQMEVSLFFLRADGESLAPEVRRVFRTATEADRARQTLQLLMDGPESGLQAALPAGTKLRELYLAHDGTAFVDLGPEFKAGIDKGSSDAVSAVYAIVNTLTYNFATISKVKILIGGDEVEDLGGHLDLSHPILPEMGLVSMEPGPAERAAGLAPAASSDPAAAQAAEERRP